ncbi:MAG: amidohydrolase [Vicinamibacteria bacterium]
MKARVLLPLSLFLGFGCRPKEPADLVLHNGKIVVADEPFSIHQAVVVEAGKIVAVGGNDLLDSYEAARVIDLEGKMAMPGFNDTHIHIRGQARRAVDLREAKSLGEIFGAVTAKANELGKGEWVTGYGWSEDQLEEKRRPLRFDLDEAAPENPVILTRAGGHSSVANSMALELAGVTRDTPDPEGGVIERDDQGELNGIIRERARIVSRLVPEATDDELRASFTLALENLLSLGITSIIQAGVPPEDYAEWERVYAEHGEDLPRAAVQIRFPEPGAIATFGKKTGDGNERLRVGAVKITVDGGFTGPAAYTLEPYKNQGQYRGKMNYTDEELAAIVKAGHEAGWQLGFHAIGDAAIVLTVDAFAEALDALPREDHRHFLNHFTVMPPEDTMKKMAQYDILIAQQPNFTYTLEGRYVDNLEGDHLQHNNALRTPMDHGIFVALGSDILPIGPMVGLYAAVTRKGVSGEVYGAEERITTEEAIRGYTAKGAFLTREENVKGTLEPGKLADIIVLSDDLLAIDPEKILDVEVLMTIVNGKVVYERS